ncbi:hypothetical protein ACFXPS_29825 [Nocardia sp. NPDC059091]|uniref:hypothetical protein n=1 Tax=unclassified Nocardia TaxID=2637762 RepID=UPI00368BADCA
MTDPVWLQRARATLTAAISGAPTVGNEVAELIEDDAVGSDGITLALLFWLDSLIDRSPSTAGANPVPMPHIWPTGMAPPQRWALRTLDARVTNDADTARALWSEATEDFDCFTECVRMVAVLAGMSLGGRLSPDAQD